MGQVLRVFTQTSLAAMILVGSLATAAAGAQSLAPVVEVVAQERSQSRDTRQSPVIDESRRKELLKFVNEHQAGVARLLRVLEQRNPQQYQRSLESLDRDVRRLENAKNRDQGLYDLGLKRWKNSSAIELMLAGIAMRGESVSDEARQVQMRRLKQLIEVREELRAQQLKMEIARLQARVGKLEEQLVVSDADRKQTVEKSAIDMLNRAKRRRTVKPPATDDKSKRDDGGQ